MIGNVSVGSVHSPKALDDLSIRGLGRKKHELTQKVIDYAAKYKISFVQAYRELASGLEKLGGEGSGNFDYLGRPGEIGGSGEGSGGKATTPTDKVRSSLHETIRNGDFDLSRANKQDVVAEAKQIAKNKGVRLSDNEIEGIVSEFV